MKIENSRLFTYPVLAAGRDDYKTCQFSADIKISSDTTDNLIFEFSCSTDCAEIKQLIENGDAEYLLHVECPTTAYREIFTRSLENFSCKVPRNNVKKELYFVAMIVLRRDVKNFQCTGLNEDFGGINFNLPKGSVLAYQNFKPLPLPDDPNILKNVASIFSIYKRSVDDEPYEIDLSQGKIKIGLNKKDYLLYCRYSSRTEMQPILNAMIILPALVYVFAELQTAEGLEIYESKDWFLSLKAAYRRKKIDLAEYINREENTPIKLAQEVMGLPITKALENIAHTFDDATED